MHIDSINLKNIKSHRDTEICFTRGINVLSGPNGVGKSTIFEAVGYALFGVEARDFVTNVDRFITIGAKRGEIAVTFSTDTGETYRVTRTVGTPANWRLACKRGDDFEIEDHANMEETEARIRELLGLSAARSLADQFKLVIGPFQNDFLGPFVLKQQTKRKEAFDEILGIDSWRKTFDGTKEMATVVKSKLESLKVEIAAKEERVVCLPERRQELKNLADQQSVKMKDLQANNTALAATIGLLLRLDGQKQAVETLRADLSQVEQSLVSGNEHTSTQRALVEQAEQAALTLAQAREGQERFQLAEKNLAELRRLEKDRQLLEKELAELATQEASAAQAAEYEEKEIVIQEKNLQEGLKSCSLQQETLAQALGELAAREEAYLQALARHRSLEAQYHQLPIHHISALVPYLKGSLRRLMEIDDLLQAKKELLLAEEDWKTKADAIEHLRREREQIMAEKAQLEGIKAGVLEGEVKLAAGLCPFFQDACQNMDGKASLAVFSDKKQQLDSQIQIKTKGIEDLEVEISGAEAAVVEMEKFRLLRHELDALANERSEREKERLAHLALLDANSVVQSFCRWAGTEGAELWVREGEKIAAPELSGTPPEQLTALEQWEEACSGLAEMVKVELGKMLARVEEPLNAIRVEQAKGNALSEELGRRRKELAAAEEVIAKRRKAAIAFRQAAAAAADQKQTKVQALALFHHVEEAISANEEVKKMTQQDHERYLQAEPTALELPKRQEMLGRFLKRLDELAREKLNKEEQLAALLAAYSSESHLEAQNQKESLQKIEAELRESLKNLDQNLIRFSREVEELEKIQLEIRTKQDEVKELRKKEDLVKLLRNKIFKNVSSQLSERFREEISLRADSIYRTIAQADEELYWGDNYQIVLRDMISGTVRERSDDQLSGGQVMSAVVALRLALLQTIGARVAFFDEPTSNLDAARRENLAQAFRAIDHGKEELTEHWYDQLFLISHDVSFTEITDQVIDLG